MDFELSGEQQQLRDSIQRFLADNYAFEHYRQVGASADGWDRDTWRGLADLGALGLSVPAEQGGLGFGCVETMALMEACGRFLVLEPVLSSAVVATALLAAHADDAGAAALLARMAQGEAIAVLAHFEGAGYEWERVETRARRDGEDYLIDGVKPVTLHAPAADELLVSARVEGEAGLAVFRVPRDTPGLRLDAYPILDGQRAADVRLEAVRIAGAGRLGGAADIGTSLEAALDAGVAGLCAQAVGAMQALLESTVQYVQNRQQFGQPIGAFQVIQHRIADMLVQLEQARSMSYLAALRSQSPDAAERRDALSAAKTLVGQAGRFVGQQAVQLHGGMGMTDELAASHWFRRLTALDILFGDSDVHLARFVAQEAARRPARA